MDRLEIFEKAVEKAEQNGWKYGKDIVDFMTNISPAGLIPFKIIIFSHDFAKAFWGSAELCEYCETPLNPTFQSFQCRCVDTHCQIAWHYIFSKWYSKKNHLNIWRNFYERK